MMDRPNPKKALDLTWTIHFAFYGFSEQRDGFLTMRLPRDSRSVKLCGTRDWISGKEQTFEKSQRSSTLPTSSTIGNST